MKKVMLLLSAIIFAVVGILCVLKSVSPKFKLEQCKVGQSIVEENVDSNLQNEDFVETENEAKIVQKDQPESVVSQSEEKEKEDIPSKKQESISNTKKQEIKQDNSKVVQKEETPVVEENKPELPKEPEIDEEYERLKKQVEYQTYEECLEAGFNIALTDTVNILGFTPIEIIYKGKVIGYRLRIDYANPMKNN